MNHIKRSIQLLFLLLYWGAHTALTQPNTPGFGLDGQEENGTIGSGLAILITLGASYGLLKLRRRNPAKT